MGYFNIFYKITRIIDMLTRKRNRRAIMVILIIIAVIFLLHNKGYCAQEDTTYTTDTIYFILQEYEILLDDWEFYFNLNYDENNQDFSYRSYHEMFDEIKNGGFPYLYSSSITNQYIDTYIYTKSMTKTIVNTSLVYNDYTRIPSTTWNMTMTAPFKVYSMRTTDGYFGRGTVQNDRNISVPQILLYKIPVQIARCMEKAGYYTTPSDMVDIKALLQEQNNKLDSINDSLTNSTYNEEVVEVDTSTIDNVSEEQITGLFTGVVGSFSNALNSYGGTITKIIPLPHGGQIEIPSNIVSSHLGNLTALVEAFWYFVFGIYLFRFVSNLIHKIKTGDILNGYTNDNEIITSSML